MNKVPHILVVDDHELRRECAKRALPDGRFKVTAVPSASRGLRYLRRLQFDAIVVGTHLRGMGAKELQDRVCRLYPETPVVEVSFTWPGGRNMTAMSPGAYHCLILCSQDKETALRIKVEEALARSAEKAKVA